MPPDLVRTLAMAIDALRDAHDPWWIISGAALALHGVTQLTVGDVDIVTSTGDAARLLPSLGIVPVPVPVPVPGPIGPLFRSRIFARWTDPPLVVEFMADLHVATDTGWQAAMPQSRLAIEIDGRVAHVPDRDDMARMLHLFGRPKDIERARMLALLPAAPAPLSGQ